MATTDVMTSRLTVTNQNLGENIFQLFYRCELLGDQLD